MARKARIAAALLSVMREGERHAWTLEELHADLAHRGWVTDFSSVFRATEKLNGDGILRKLVLEDGRSRFELLGGHHDHLYCARCHELVPVPCIVGPEEFAALERATGAEIRDHQVILSGLCRDCRAVPENSEAAR